MITDVPFNKSGDQLHYPDYNPVWTDNLEFDDILEFREFRRGQSAAYSIFSRLSNGKEVTVFLKDFVALIPHMISGRVAGKFTFCKRGQNYGCKVVQP